MTQGINLYERTSKPIGKAWEEWVELWWKWCYSMPFSRNPVLDETGKFCCENQVHPRAWFLAGTFGGKATRECEIPFGRSIFFPVVNDLISFAEYPELQTQRELHEYAKRDLDTTKSLSLIADGVSTNGLWDCRVHSELFDIEIPMSRNGEKKIKTRAVSEGYWAFIRSLPRGRHVLSFMGEKEAFDQNKDESKGRKTMFTIEVMYHLLVS